MNTNWSPLSTVEERFFQETPMEIGAWGVAPESMVPARHVVWATLALIVATLAVLVVA